MLFLLFAFLQNDLPQGEQLACHSLVYTRTNCRAEVVIYDTNYDGRVDSAYNKLLPLVKRDFKSKTEICIQPNKEFLNETMVARIALPEGKTQEWIEVYCLNGRIWHKVRTAHEVSFQTFKYTNVVINLGNQPIVNHEKIMKYSLDLVK